MSLIRKCPECGKELLYKDAAGLQKAERNNNKCKSCANKKEKLGKIGIFIRKCSVCGKDVIFNNQRSYSLSCSRFECFCAECRSKRYSRTCPICGITINMTVSSRAKRFEGKNCKSCESLIRISEKKGYGFSGTYNGVQFRSTSELSFMMNEKRPYISGEIRKYAVEYFFKDKIHLYYPDFIVENEMIECKPLYAQTGDQFNLKKDAAEKWCKANNMSYKVIDPPSISKNDLLNLHLKGVVILNPKTLKSIQ